VNAVVHDDNVNSTNAVLHGADNISDAGSIESIEEFKASLDDGSTFIDDMNKVVVQMMNVTRSNEEQKVTTQLNNNLTRAIGKDCGILDTGTNSYHAFTNKEWFSLGVHNVTPMRAACGNEHESIITVMGDAYAKAYDSNGMVRYLKFSNSTLQKELPANLICVDKLLFDEKGNERDIDVDFKKLKLHMSQHSSEAYDFDIVRKQKLPLLQIQPLTQDDLRAMTGQAREKLITMKGSAESVMLANINLVKMTWQYLHDMLGHQCDDYIKKSGDSSNA